MGAYAIILLPKIKELAETHNVVLDGLYSWEELKIIKEVFLDDLTTIAIIVDKNTRYERLSVRSVRPFTKEKAKESLGLCGNFLKRALKRQTRKNAYGF